LTDSCDQKKNHNPRVSGKHVLKKEISGQGYDGTVPEGGVRSFIFLFLKKDGGEKISTLLKFGKRAIGEKKGNTG